MNSWLNHEPLMEHPPLVISIYKCYVFLVVPSCSVRPSVSFVVFFHKSPEAIMVGIWLITSHFVFYHCWEISQSLYDSWVHVYHYWLLVFIPPLLFSLSLSIRKNSMIDHAWSLFRNYFRMEHNKCAMTFKQMYPSLYWLVYSGPHQRLRVLPTNKPGRIPSGNQMWQWKIPYKEVKKREHHLLNKASMTPEIHDKQHIYPVLLQATSEYSKVAMRFF